MWCRFESIGVGDGLIPLLASTFRKCHQLSSDSQLQTNQANSKHIEKVLLLCIIYASVSVCVFFLITCDSYLFVVAMCPVLHVEGLRTLPGICVVGHQRAGSSLCVHSAFHLWWWCLLSFFTAYHSLFLYIAFLNFITCYHQLLSFQSHFSVLYLLWHASLLS